MKGNGGVKDIVKVRVKGGVKGDVAGVSRAFSLRSGWVRRAATLASLILALNGLASALSCNEPANRYRNQNIFSSVKQTSNIQFGSNKNPLHSNNTENLFTDIFQPNNDTCTKRPLVIFMWGGGFQGGNRQGENGDCQNFAKRGFVCATTDYRMGNGGSYTIPNFCGPTFMSTQDTRAAIRFFKKNGAQYGIDTSLIYIGGCSSGAYAAMHTGYLDETSEIPTYLASAITAGGIEGTGGNPGYNSRPAGVLSLSGGLFDSNWVTPGSVPAAMVGCTQDPIESPDSLGQNGGPPFFISDFDFQRLGPHFKHAGVTLLTKPIQGNCHCPHPTDGTVGDQSIDFLAKSAYTFMTTPTVSVALPRWPPFAALSAADLARLPQGEEWVDARGERVDLKSRNAGNAQGVSFRPGLYFRRPHGALGGRR